MRPRIALRLAALFGLLLVMPVQAAPLGTLDVPDSAALSLITPVHNCHRSAQDSHDGWHRHSGPYCRMVRSGPSERNPYARCRTKCEYVGPIKECRRVCW